VIHRDIKPDNFVIGRGNNSHLVYLIDFGESYSYVVDGGENHIHQGRHGFVGTRRYASMHAHQGYDQGRRDDMISLGYTLIFLLKGEEGLPWQGLHIPKSERDAKIAEIKNETKVETLLEGCPDEFVQYMHHVNKLEFKDKPDYHMLRKLFKDYAQKNNFKDEIHLFDWELQQQRLHEDSIFTSLRRGLRGSSFPEQLS
jgi:serine/threonine protein kinase